MEEKMRKLRAELTALMVGNCSDYEKIYQISVELDELITEYYQVCAVSG